jgi:hypothetical protein
MVRRVADLSVLPGEPLDGSGRVCVHLFVRDEAGPFVEPHVLRQKVDESGEPVKGQLVASPTRGRLACDPRRQVAPVARGQDGKGRLLTKVTMRTDDPRAVSCPRCKASRDYADMMAKMGG